MGWIPGKPSDAFWFAVAPITAGPTLVYGAAGYVTDDYPLGKPDWRANVRNSLLWTGAAASVYAWNLAMSPHNAVWMSGTDAYKTAFHIGGAPLAFAALAVASAVGWAATVDHHGGVPPGELGMGMPVTDSGALEDMRRMSWSDLWPF